VTLGVTTMALIGVSLSGCGNAGAKQKDDTRPEPNASTEGVRSVFPSAAPEGALTTASPNPGSGGDETEPQLEPPTNGQLPR
jgi:hypothetical protein